MLAITDYWNDEHISPRKSQRVSTAFEHDENARVNSADDLFLDMLMDDRLVSSEPTNLNVKKYIARLRKDDRV